MIRWLRWGRPRKHLMRLYFYTKWDWLPEFLLPPDAVITFPDKV